MEFLVASAIGVMTAAGIYMVLRARTFPVVIGLSLLHLRHQPVPVRHRRLAIGRPPVISCRRGGLHRPAAAGLALTAIVISFGMTAVVVVMALRA